MPLLGKLDKGMMRVLVELMQDSGKDSILKVETPDQNGEIYVESGKVVRIQQQHSKLEESLEELLNSERGTFLLHRPEDEEMTEVVPSQLPVWLLDQNVERRQPLGEMLKQLNIASATVLDGEHLVELLEDQHPKLLLLGDTDFFENKELLWEPLLNTHEHFTLVLIGQQSHLSEEEKSLVAAWLKWPITQAELTIFLKRWLHLPSRENSFHEQEESFLPSGILQLMSRFTPKIDETLFLRVNPAHINAIKQAKLPIKWFNWLISIQPNQPALHWLASFPGPLELAEMVLHYLLHLQILERAEPQQVIMGRLVQNSSSSEVASQGRLHSQNDFAQIASRQRSSDTFILLKVIVFGLRGERRREWLNSLKQISKSQSAKVSREHSAHVPHLPKVELVRIPLKSDTLLVVYSSLTESSVDELIEQIGVNLTSFLFFLDLDNQHELLYIRNLRKKLLERYQLPDLVMVSGTQGRSREMVEQQLGLGSLWHPIDQFDVQTSYKLLRILLLRTASPDKKNH